MSDDHFTITEAAEAIGISDKRLVALVEEGKLTVRVVGPRCLGIRKTDVMALRLALALGGHE